MKQWPAPVSPDFNRKLAAYADRLTNSASLEYRNALMRGEGALVGSGEVRKSADRSTDPKRATAASRSSAG